VSPCQEIISHSEQIIDTECGLLFSSYFVLYLLRLPAYLPKGLIRVGPNKEVSSHSKKKIKYDEEGGLLFPSYFGLCLLRLPAYKPRPILPKGVGPC